MMVSQDGQSDTPRTIMGRFRRSLIAVALLSALANVMMLGGSLYMMMVYDSVLPSHSLVTLFALLALLLVVYCFQGLAEGFRARILGDIANRFDMALSHRVQRAMIDRTQAVGRGAGDGLEAMRDLDNVRGWMAGPGPAVLMDLPWILFFIGILTLMHFWTGLTALVGGILLVALTLVADRAAREPSRRIGTIASFRNGQADATLRNAEVMAAMGMTDRMIERWQRINHHYLDAQSHLSRTVATLGGVSKIGRMALQSLILTVGAILVIEGKASGGVIFASSILAGRALAPVDQVIGNWRSLAAARNSWRRLGALMEQLPLPRRIETALPRPSAVVQAENLFIAPPGTQSISVQGINFTLKAGDGLAIIGPSAAGKSSLGRALVGAWHPVRGSVRLDGAALDQWPGDTLGDYIGYLPQTVDLFEGTVAENIARFQPDPSSEAIVAAAKAANIHDMIVALPLGYETVIGESGRNLSAGQQQRIGLARALYRDPFLIVLDEPNSNLDADGEAALEQAIAQTRMRGGIVVVIAHRPSALAKVNLVLVLREGKMEAIGPRDEILQRMTGRPVPVPQSAPPAAPQTTDIVATAAAGSC